MLSKWRAMGRTVAVATGILLMGGLLMAGTADAETAFIEAVADATLIQHPDGALANGSGPVFFVGRSNQRENSVRRSVLRFDVASALPARARIEDVRLTLYMTPSNAAPRMLRLHRLLSAWSEGDSYATGGGGATSSAGDATWVHTLYDELRWRHAGRDFVSRVSAVRRVAEVGPYTWGGNAEDEGGRAPVAVGSAAQLRLDPGRGRGQPADGQDLREPGSPRIPRFAPCSRCSTTFPDLGRRPSGPVAGGARSTSPGG